MKQRTEKLLAAMPRDFEAALISTDVNRFYFLGFDSGDAGTVLILPEKTYFIIDSRYIEIAEATVKDAEVILEKKALEQVRELLTENHFTIGNVDATLVAQKPRIAPYVRQMRQNIAQDLDIPLENVSVKATTEERLGFTGDGSGMSAQAAALIFQE